ncbi:cupin domain-containing protein [Enterocloster sp. OA13]|uniref:helix-turn-helix domain-containing protein n=1 Tax=Enterocloster TaxID=2719313 RepID=UPI000472BFCD|nr:cupin domain-containing protein [Lachnoclostridium pacaense]MCC2879531.1 cupin domain-containing protein [Lachnoclostridium pacaense]MCH1952350.1 cupin domain-containing protein [Enterocloster sp. OA13]
MIENIGRKIKTFRNRYGMTIQEMAEQSGVSSSLLSQMERGIGNPTISVLEAVSHVMDCSVADLLAEDVKNSDLVVRHRERKRIYEGQKETAMYGLLSDKVVRGNFDMILIVLPPHSEVDSRLSRHPEEEASFILKGNAVFEFDGEVIPLEEGDTIRVLSNRNHRVLNIQDEECVIICTRNRILS